MGKLLRVLVGFFLLFSIAALVLGILLFNKRELLKGRTQKLETALIKLGATIEAEPAPAPGDTYVSRDIDDCTPDIIDNPATSDFWDSYKTNLEKQGIETLDIDKRKRDLMTYYLRDPFDNKIKVDAAGLKITEGDGTMQNLLNDILEKARQQLDRLNETRQQLTDLREEHIVTIEELNDRKMRLREALNTIVQLEATIDELNAEIAGLKDTIAQLEDEKRKLEEQIVELQREIEELEQDKKELEGTIEVLKKEIEDLRNPIDPDSKEARRALPIGFVIQPGVKGKVAAVNPDWNFVVLQLTDEFLLEVLGKDLDRNFAPIDVYLKRTVRGEDFVSKVRILQIRKEEKIGVGDILSDWQHLPVKEGDVVFY
jgi:hypothetical protein